MARASIACPGCGVSLRPATFAPEQGADRRSTRITVGQGKVLPRSWPSSKVATKSASTYKTEFHFSAAGNFTNRQSILSNDLGSTVSICPSIVTLKRPLPIASERHASWQRGSRLEVVCAAANGAQSEASAKLVIFLGKGGSGKTTAAVLLAKVRDNSTTDGCLILRLVLLTKGSDCVIA
jgi:hypothetical protein